MQQIHIEYEENPIPFHSDLEGRSGHGNLVTAVPLCFWPTATVILLIERVMVCILVPRHSLRTILPPTEILFGPDS